MNKNTFYIILAILIGLGVLTQNLFNTPQRPNVTVSQTFQATSDISIATPKYEGCGYMWAYHDDPELTAKIDEAIRQLDPIASARAQQFGEDCVYADGHSTFSVMETDLYVHRPIEDLTDNESFGNWIAQVMTMVTQIPREELQGSNYGFVEFSFEKSDTEHLIVRVPIQKYLEDGQGKTGNELLQLFIETP